MRACENISTSSKGSSGAGFFAVAHSGAAGVAVEVPVVTAGVAIVGLLACLDSLPSVPVHENVFRDIG